MELLQNMNDIYLGYARKSSESEDRQMESIPAQLEELKKTALVKDITIHKIFQESGSAKAPGRKEFNKMVSFIESNDIAGLICWDLSRLFRNSVDEGRIRWLLDIGKIGQIITPYKTYSKDDSSLIMAVEGGKNQAFIQDLRRNTKRGINRKLEKGMYPALAPPGYANDTHMRQGEKTISPHPVYFEMLKEIFNLALTGNYSVQKLYEKAEKLGIQNSRGKLISKTQMYKLLTNPFYKGEFQYSGEIYQGIHKALITNEEYEIIQNHLKERARPRGQDHVWALTGLVKCDACGRQITAEQHTKKSGLVFCYYKCTGKYRYKCPTPYVPSGKLEQMAYDYLGKIKLSSRFVEWAIKILKRATDEEKAVHDSKFDLIRKQYDKNEKTIYSLKMKYATTDRVDDSTYDQGMNELKANRRRFNKILSKEEKDFDLLTDITVATFKFARDAQDKWNDGDPIYRKGIMRVIGSELVLNKDGILEIKPRTPFLMIEKAVQSSMNYQNTRLNSQIEPKTGIEGFSDTFMGE